MGSLRFLWFPETMNEYDRKNKNTRTGIWGMLALVLVILGLIIHTSMNTVRHISAAPPASTAEARQMSLAFRVQGRIENMFFEEGASVRAGDILATLDKKPFEE